MCRLDFLLRKETSNSYFVGYCRWKNVTSYDYLQRYNKENNSEATRFRRISHQNAAESVDGSGTNARLGGGYLVKTHQSNARETWIWEFVADAWCFFSAQDTSKTEKAHRNKADILMILSSCTSKCQLMDVCINKLFKSILRKCWVECVSEMMDKEHVHLPPFSRQDVADLVEKAYNYIWNNTKLFSRSLRLWDYHYRFLRLPKWILL